MSHSLPPNETEGKGKWLALAAALLGWMFDGAEMAIFSLVGRPAVKDLMGASTPESELNIWFNIIIASFLVGAATGGVLFGWLGDRIGRVKAMTFSVLIYALFTGLCGFAGEAWQVGVLRFIAALGMGGEWSLGVALVMEVWPNRSRAFMAGLIGAAANVGYLVVGFVGLALLQFIGSLSEVMLGLGISQTNVDWLTANSGWRIMMILGAMPAVLTLFIRLFVPESEKWEEEKSKGSTNSWATRDLTAVLVGLIGPALLIWAWGFKNTNLLDGKIAFEHHLAMQIPVTIVGLLIALGGYLYPVVRFFQRQALIQTGAQQYQRQTIQRMLFGACLSGIVLLGTWGSIQQLPSWIDEITENSWKAEVAELKAAGEVEKADALERPRAKEFTLIWLSIGAIIGTILAALAGDWIGRRPAYCLLCALSLASVWIIFLTNNAYTDMFLFWAFIAGATTASFYGWLPLYLPELFPTSVRATGQGFAFNFGRILAAIGVLQVGNLHRLFDDKTITIFDWTSPPGRPLACSAIVVVYLIGMVLIWFGPETRGKELPT